MCRDLAADAASWTLDRTRYVEEVPLPPFCAPTGRTRR